VDGGLLEQEEHPGVGRERAAVHEPAGALGVGARDLDRDGVAAAGGGLDDDARAGSGLGGAGRAVERREGGDRERARRPGPAHHGTAQ
jgi:hypothetical protein